MNIYLYNLYIIKLIGKEVVNRCIILTQEYFYSRQGDNIFNYLIFNIFNYSYLYMLIIYLICFNLSFKSKCA
jgi:hypothetical protein